MKKVSLILLMLAWCNYVFSQEIDAITTFGGSEGAWTPSGHQDYQYDENRNLTQVLNQYWNGQEWVTTVAIQFEYNAEGLESKRTIRLWNASDSAYRNLVLFELTYTSSKKLETETTSNWTGEEWKASEKKTYSYEHSTGFTEILTQVLQGDEWINGSKSIKHTYIGGNDTVFLNQWNPVASNWKKNSRTIEVTDNNGNKIEAWTEAFGLGEWTLTTKELHKYDKNNNLIASSYLNWNNSKKAWDDSRKNVRTLNEDGKDLIIISKTFVPSRQEWMISGKDTLTYLAPQQNSVKRNQSIELNVYPNPSTDVLNIQNPDNNIFQYEVLNMQGQSIINGTLNTQNTIGITNLPSGNYILRLKSENKHSINKFIKL